MSNAYIELANSNSSLDKKFRVVSTGYAPGLDKVQTQRVTITGKVDNQVGPVIKRWKYTFKVYHTDPDGSDWGTLANLKTFYSYNDPSGTPSNVVTLTDFDESTYSVYVVGTFSEKNVSVSIEGTTACFLVPIEMVEVSP